MDTNVVTFHYTLRNLKGELLDSSSGGRPITYLEGSDHIITGLEEQMKGLVSGTKKVINVTADKAYGQRNDKMVQNVKRSLLPVDELHVGDRFQAGEDHHAPVVTVTAINGDEVTLDGNHPLAGVDLVFDVEVVEMRAATQDEIDHGHVHGPGGHQH